MIVFGLAVLVLCLTSTVAAGTPSGDRAAPATVAALLEARIAAGDLHYRDTRTGEVVLATETRVDEIRTRLAPQFDWPAGASVDVADDGTISADIDGAMRDVMVVRTRLDGTRERGCFRDLDAAVAFIVGLDIDTAKRVGDQRPVKVNE
ncbi:MAG: hypothetical protein PVG53_14455 [Holophagae bacterium]|jgi:hypothetical protein